MSNKRESADGFDGRYPRNDSTWVEDAYRAAGMEPPWLLEYEDGKVIGGREADERPAPRHEA